MEDQFHQLGTSADNQFNYASQELNRQDYTQHQDYLRSQHLQASQVFQQHADQNNFQRFQLIDRQQGSNVFQQQNTSNVQVPSQYALPQAHTLNGGHSFGEVNPLHFAQPSQPSYQSRPSQVVQLPLQGSQYVQTPQVFNGGPLRHPVLQPNQPLQFSQISQQYPPSTSSVQSQRLPSHIIPSSLRSALPSLSHAEDVVDLNVYLQTGSGGPVPNLTPGKSSRLPAASLRRSQPLMTECHEVLKPDQVLEIFKTAIEYNAKDDFNYAEGGSVFFFKPDKVSQKEDWRQAGHKFRQGGGTTALTPRCDPTALIIKKTANVKTPDKPSHGDPRFRRITWEFADRPLHIVIQFVGNSCVMVA